MDDSRLWGGRPPLQRRLGTRRIRRASSATRRSRRLVTGATGLVASSLVETLLHANETVEGETCNVMALVRNEDEATERFAHYKSRSDLRFLVQDVSEPLPSNVRTDFVIHAAGNATP